MQWFSEVNDALSILKCSDGLILVVSVEENEHMRLSAQLDIALKNLGSESKFVGLHISVASALYKQLCAIYHVIPAPCLFFIRGDGQPIDIVENNSIEEIQLRIAQVVNSVAISSRSNGGSNIGESASKRSLVLLEEGSSIRHAPTHNNGTTSSQGQKSSKQQKLQDGSGDKDAVDACVQNEGEGEPRGETAQGLTPSEGDNENWQVVYQNNTYDDGEENDFSDSSWPPPGNNYEPPIAFAAGRSALIHFRLPSGESYTHEFSIDATVRDLYDYVGDNIRLPFNSWSLALVFPRRDLEANDHETVTDLLLVPNGVVLIVPAPEPEPDFYRDASNFVTTIFTRPWSVLYSIWSYVYSYIFPPTESEENMLANTQELERLEQNTNQFSSSRRQARMPVTNVTRDGNVHRLRFRRSDDEDNNTWNGNSTQQM